MVLRWSVPIRGRKLPTGRPSERCGAQHSVCGGWAEDRCAGNYRLDIETSRSPRTAYRQPHWLVDPHEFTLTRCRLARQVGDSLQPRAKKKERSNAPLHPVRWI